MSPARCAWCGGRSDVLQSRVAPGVVRRRRRCLACGARWTTREAVSEPRYQQPAWLRRAVAEVRGRGPWAGELRAAVLLAVMEEGGMP